MTITAPSPLREEDLYAIGVGRRPAWDGRARPPARRLPWIRMTLCICAAIWVIAYFARDPAMDPVRSVDVALPPAPELVAPPPRWRHLAQPEIVLELHDPGFARLPTLHEARLHVSGGLEDSVDFGRFEAPEPHLRVILIRQTQDGSASSFFVELARRAARWGIAVARGGQPGALHTRFGFVEVAPAQLENGSVRECLAFRRPAGLDELRLFGWFCPAAPLSEPESRERLACALDGLVLLGPAGDAQIAGAFAASDAHRSPSCGPPQSVAGMREGASVQEASGRDASQGVAPRIVMHRVAPPPRPR